MKKENSKISWWRPAVFIFARLSVWIAGPVILAVAIGKWLDRKYGAEPWLFLASVGIAFAVSMVGIVKNAMREMDKLNQKSKLKIKNDSSK